MSGLSLSNASLSLVLLVLRIVSHLFVIFVRLVNTFASPSRILVTPSFSPYSPIYSLNGVEFGNVFFDEVSIFYFGSVILRVWFPYLL